MTYSLPAGTQKSFVVSLITLSNSPSSAVLSNLVLTSSDPTVFSVNVSLAGGLISAIAVGSATLSISATATETSGAVEQFTLTVAITVTPEPAAGLIVTFE